MANPIRPNTYSDGQTADALRVNEDLDTIYGWAGTDAMHRDGSTAFSALPSGPGGSTVPVQNAQLANKLYVDQAVAAATASTPTIYVRRTRETSMPIANNSEIRINWTVVDRTQGSPAITYSGSPDRQFVIPQTGLYAVSVGVDLSMNSSGQHAQLRVFRNTTARAADSRLSGANGTCRMSISLVDRFASGQTVAAALFQASGANASLSGNGQTFMSITRIGP